MAYFHGSETDEVEQGPISVQEVRSAVIGLTGYAPAGDAQKLIVCKSISDAAQFGAPLPGFTIPQALKAIFDQGQATVIVVNLTGAAHYDDKPLTTTTDETLPATASNETSLSVFPDDASAVVVKEGATTLVQGTDYSISAAGVITIIDTVTYPNGTILTATYAHNEKHTVDDMKAKLASPPKDGAVTWVKNADGTTTYTEGTDYTVDAYGVISIILGGGISEGDVILIDYKYFNTGNTLAADFVGTFVSGVRTGMKLYEEAYSTFSFKPKIFIAPEYSTVDGVWQELRSYAENDSFKAFCILDGRTGDDVATAITRRAPASLGNFNTSSKRTILAYPRVLDYDLATDGNVTRAMSPYLAGVIASIDNGRGFHYSFSNKEIKGIVGMERQITWSVNDKTSEANALNEVGIVTLASGFGTGIRTWGNRSAAFPTISGGESFVSVRRTMDLLIESVEVGMLPYIDQPITQRLIDDIKATVNGFINSLKQRGALVAGSCIYDPNKNPQTQIDQGQLVFDVEILPPSPAERITFKVFRNPDLAQFE